VAGLLSRNAEERLEAMARFARRAAPESKLAFVGRERAIATLEDAAAEVACGSSKIVIVEGPSGMGKTALLEEIRRRWQSRVVLEGRAGEAEHVPFNLFDGVADGLADGELVPADLRPTLAHAFPVLGVAGRRRRGTRSSPRCARSSRASGPLYSCSTCTGPTPTASVC
jgi:hypothetical protein